MKRSKCNDDDVQIDNNRAVESFGDGLDGTDRLRVASMNGLVRGKRAKLAGSRRERARLEAKHGKDSERVRQLDRQMVVEHRQLVETRREQGRVTAEVPEKQENAFILYGHVRDVDGHPMEAFQVGLYPDPKSDEKPIKKAPTDKKGRYDLVIGGGKGEKARIVDRDSASAAENVNGSAQRMSTIFYLRVFDSNGKERDIPCTPITAALGMVSYKDVILPTQERHACDTMPTQYLGNASSRELHNLKNEKPTCHIDQIAPDRRVYFRNPAMAEKAGYDYCGHCFGRGKSKR